MTDFAEKLMLIAECELCDETGIHLGGLHQCDHIDYGAIARRHLPAIKESLKKGRK